MTNQTPLPDPGAPGPSLDGQPGTSVGRRWRATTVPYLALRGGGQALELLGWVILARRLGSTAFGQLSVGVLVCRYGGLVADWGASIAGVRDVAANRHPGSIRRLLRLRALTTIGLSTVYVGATIVLGVSQLAPLVLMLIGIGMNRDWIALGQERGGRSAAPAALQGLLLAGLAVVSTSATPSLAVAVSYGAALMLSIALNPVPPLSADQDQELEAVDAWMLLAVVSNQVLSSADIFLIAGLLSASAAGVYAAVYRIPNGWLALLVIVRSGLLPLATSLRHTDPDGFRDLRRTSIRWGVLGGAVLLALTPLLYLAIPVVYGEDYLSGQGPAVLLLTATAIATVGAPLHHLFLAFGDDRPYAMYLTAAAGANVVLNLALIPVFGLMGAAAATLAANVILVAVLWHGLGARLRTLPAPVDAAGS